MEHQLLNHKFPLIIHKFDEQDMDILYPFFKKYGYLEDTLKVAEIVRFSYKEVKKLLDEEAKELDLHETFRTSQYYLTKYIIFYRMYIDNLKYIENKLRLDFKLSDIERKKEQKLIKAMRDFANHSSIPIKNAVRSISFTNATDETFVSISKNNLMEGLSNKKSLDFLKSLSLESIEINEFLNQWNIDFDKLYKNVSEIFIRNLNSEEVELLKDNEEHFRVRFNFAYPSTIRAVIKGRPILEKCITFDPDFFQIFLDNFDLVSN